MQVTIQYIKSELAEHYPKTEIDGFVRLIFESILNFSYTDIILHENKKLMPGEVEQIQQIIRRLKNFEPIQYILGETEFYDLKIKVNRATLIPRPETEELVHWICKSDIRNGTDILDIGTGSGCIALALKNELVKVKVDGIDVSLGALGMAKENATLNKLDVNFKHADILTWQNREWKEFGVIVSNPPYVRNCEKELMESNVLDYEPDGALFVEDDNPLIFYKTIAEFAQANLVNDGFLFFEINEYLGEEMKIMLNGLGFRNIELRKDLSGKDRMLKCQK